MFRLNGQNHFAGTIVMFGALVRPTALPMALGLALTAFHPGYAHAADNGAGAAHESRLSQLVDRLQTGSIPAGTPGASAAKVHENGFSCGKVRAIADKDIVANAGEMDGLCLETITFSENDTRWTLQKITSGKPGPLWAVFHDDGDAAFAAALYGVKRYGGTVLAVEADEHALNAGYDPEGMFTSIEAATSGSAKDWPRYAALFMYEAYNAPAVVSLRSSAVIGSGKTASLVTTGVDAGVVAGIRERSRVDAKEMGLTWLDAGAAEEISSFPARLFASRAMPYFLIEVSGEDIVPCVSAIDIIAASAQLAEVAPSKQHYSAEGSFNSN